MNYQIGPIARPTPQNRENPIFRKKCLHCGRPNDSTNYTCTCRQAHWSKEYRMLGLEVILSEKAREKARQSFRDYAFDSPRGILQYTVLPNREYLPDGLPGVGLTPFYPLPEYSKFAGSPVFIKDEGDNPSGCFKDRETLMCLLNTRRRGLGHVVIYSSGNAAASAALFTKKLKLGLITFVAGDTYPEKIDYIQDQGSDVIVIGDENTNFEEGFRLFARLNADETFAENGFDNWTVRNPYRVQGDKTTSLEIVKQLSAYCGKKTVPEYVTVPTANGSCLAGMWQGFKELHRLGIIDSLPKMVSAGIENANPVFRAVQEEVTSHPVRSDLENLDPEDANIGSIIVAEEGYDSIQAAKAVLESGGSAVEVNTADIQQAMTVFLEKEQRLALEYSISPEPASYTALAAIEKLKEAGKLGDEDRIVAVLTGNGLKAREAIQELLAERKDLQDIAGRAITSKKVTEAPRRGRRVEVPATYEAVKRAFLKWAPAQ